MRLRAAAGATLAPARAMDNAGRAGLDRRMTERRDAIIVGGGLIGPATALALAEAGLRTTLIDALPVEVRGDADFDGRAYNVSLASRRFLEVVGVWPEVAGEAQPVARIRIEDARPGEREAPGLLHFDHAELDEGPASQILEDRFLRRALLTATLAHPRIETRAPLEIVETREAPGGAEATTADGETLRAAALIACDGRESPIARRAGIRRLRWGYDQDGMVCAVEHARDHEGVARQRFLPGGPFAVLPLPGRRCSLVWTERRAEAERIAALDDAAYLREVERRMGGALGALRLVGRRWRYPLGFSLAEEWVRPRLALVGDAAHSVHPIAGQGLNLGLRDAAALAEVLGEARRRGEDVGALDVLERYQRWRRFDATSLALGMDGLNRLMSNDVGPLRALRDAGMGLVERLPGAKRAFMRIAAGAEGDAPRMLRGERV